MRLTLMTIKRNGLQQVGNKIIKTFHHDAKRYPFDSSSIWGEIEEVKKQFRKKFEGLELRRQMKGRFRGGGGEGNFGPEYI